MSEHARNRAEDGRHDDAGGVANVNIWWCHLCDELVCVCQDSDGEDVCEKCGKGFIEKATESVCDFAAQNRSPVNNSSSNREPQVHDEDPFTPFMTAVAPDNSVQFQTPQEDAQSGHQPPWQDASTAHGNVWSTSSSSERPPGFGDLFRTLLSTALSPNVMGHAATAPFMFFAPGPDGGVAEGGTQRQYEFVAHTGHAPGGDGFGPRWTFRTTTEASPGWNGIESFLGGFSNAFNILSDQGFQNVLQFIMDNDPNRHGSPPTSNRILSSMTPKTLDASTAVGDCAVCQELFKAGDKVHLLSEAWPQGDDSDPCTCTHVFHEDCIMPWLRQHNSCPVCRYELPTDDEHYERQKEEVRQRLREARRAAPS